MATAAEIKTAYRAVVRVDLNDATANAIAASGVALDTYINGLIAQQASTTGAAVAIASFITGVTPTSAKLDELKVAADAQVASYTALKVSDPSLGAFEAFGRSFATDATTTAGFNTKYGALSSTDFINVVYAQVYGATPSAGAFANLSSQIAFFTNLFTVNNVPNAALAAKGAVLGQIVGYAFVSAASANSNLDNQVNAVLSQAAKGDTTVYAKALPVVVDPGTVGVNITGVVAGTAVGLNVADPAFKSTNFNDTITGTIDVTNRIDAGGGDDRGNFTVGGNITFVAGGLVGVETVAVTTTAAAILDMDKAVGYKSVGFVDGTAASPGSFTNLAAGTTLFVTDTDPANAPASQAATFTLKDFSGSTDVAALTLNGVNGNPTITLSGYETLNLTASGADTTGVTFADADLKTVAITATKAVTAAFGAPAGLEAISGTGAGAVTLTAIGNAVKTIDFSAASGAVTIAAVGSGTTSIKGGSGADSFGGVSKNGTSLELGGGNDSVTFTLAGTDAAKVTGGAGADTFNTTAGGTTKVTAVYLAGTESTVTNTDTFVNFDKGQDKIDLKALALTADKTAINTFASLVAVADGTDYFSGKAVAYGNFAGGGYYVLADVNGNSKFDVNTDLIISVNAGLGNVLITDFIFV